MARMTQGFDPQHLGPQVELVNEQKEKLSFFKENYSLYIPLVMGVITALGLYATRSKNKEFRKTYNEYYPLINGITMMIPAYFSWKTIQIRKAEKEIAEKQQNVLGNYR